VSSSTAEHLLAAGREELRAVGPEALTIRTVAQRAGVSSATAYTYLASKNRLYAELFWRFLVEDSDRAPEGVEPVERVRSVTRNLSHRLASAPELAAAVTPALLGTDPEVDELRLRIGAELVRRFRTAVGDGDPAMVEALVEALGLAFSGALLQAGMGLMSYTEMGERLDAVVGVIMRGNA
jgi:AcrR family transcriptional regulator